MILAKKRRDKWRSLMAERREIGEDEPGWTDYAMSLALDTIEELESDLRDAEHVYERMVSKLGDARPDAYCEFHALDELIASVTTLRRITDIVRSVRTTRGESVHYRALKVIAQIIEEAAP